MWGGGMIGAPAKGGGGMPWEPPARPSRGGGVSRAPRNPSQTPDREAESTLRAKPKEGAADAAKEVFRRGVRRQQRHERRVLGLEVRHEHRRLGVAREQDRHDNREGRRR